MIKNVIANNLKRPSISTPHSRTAATHFYSSSAGPTPPDTLHSSSKPSSSNWAEHSHAFSALAEEQHCGEQVPGVFGDHVGGEDVDLVERVITLLVVVRHELAEISGAGAHGGRLHL